MWYFVYETSSKAIEQVKFLSNHQQNQCLDIIDKIWKFCGDALEIYKYDNTSGIVNILDAGKYDIQILLVFNLA